MEPTPIVAQFCHVKGRLTPRYSQNAAIGIPKKVVGTRIQTNAHACTSSMNL